MGGYNEKGIPRDIVVAEYQIHKAMVVEDAKGVPSSVIGYLLKNPIVGKLAGKLLSNLMDKIDPTASAMKEGVGLRAEIAFDEQIPEEYYMKVYSVDEFNEKMNEFSAYEGSDLLRPIDETKDEAIKRSSLFPNKEAVEVK